MEAGDGVAVDVGIHDADLEAALGQRNRQVNGHGGLAHAALAGRHREHASGGIRLGEGDDGVGGIAANLLADLAALLVAHHVGGDGNVLHAGDGFCGLASLLCQVILHRATGDSEVDFYRHVATVDLDGFHHAEICDGSVELGILYAG